MTTDIAAMVRRFSPEERRLWLMLGGQVPHGLRTRAEWAPLVEFYARWRERRAGPVDRYQNERSKP